MLLCSGIILQGIYAVLPGSHTHYALCLYKYSPLRPMRNMIWTMVRIFLQLVLSHPSIRHVVEYIAMQEQGLEITTVALSLLAKYPWPISHGTHEKPCKHDCLFKSASWGFRLVCGSVSSQLSLNAMFVMLAQVQLSSHIVPIYESQRTWPFHPQASNF